MKKKRGRGSVKMDYIRIYDAGKRNEGKMKKKMEKGKKSSNGRRRKASPLGDHFTGVIALELETGNRSVPAKKRK